MWIVNTFALLAAGDTDGEEKNLGEPALLGFMDDVVEVWCEEAAVGIGGAGAGFEVGPLGVWWTGQLDQEQLVVTNGSDADARIGSTRGNPEQEKEKSPEALGEEGLIGMRRISWLRADDDVPSSSRRDVSSRWAWNFTIQ